MQFTILSPTRKESYPVSWVEFESMVGNFVIQPGHAPMIVVLKPNSLSTCLLRNGKQTTVGVSSGVVEVTRASVTFLLDS